MKEGFNNEVIYITGATAGIGFASAELLLKKGATVVITGRNNETLSNAEKKLHKISSNVIAHNIDVSNDLLRRQITLIGSWTFSKHGQYACAEYIADKKLKVDKLFTHEWRLNQAKEANELFDKQSDGKGVIYPS